MIKLFNRDRDFFKEIKFPCAACVVFSGCTKICDEIEWNIKKLTRHFNKHYLTDYLKISRRRGRFVCPDCGGPARKKEINIIQCKQCKHIFVLKYTISEMTGIITSVNRWTV
ncbi:hypothetical protein KAR91_25030 [Candidatus Pacearchaeota archaeon]|nr:hypothetical protein [Candidatus Pacearchaeota archaeon]